MKSIRPIVETNKTYRKFVYLHMRGLLGLTNKNDISYLNKLYDSNLRVVDENVIVQILRFMNIDISKSIEQVYINLLSRVNTIASNFGISCMYNNGKPIHYGFTDNYEYYISKEYNKYKFSLPDEYKNDNFRLTKTCYLTPIYTNDTELSFKMPYEKDKVVNKELNVFQIDLIGIGLGYYCYLRDEVEHKAISKSPNNYVSTYIWGNYNIYRNIFNLYNINYYQLLTNMDAGNLIEYKKPIFTILPYTNRDKLYLNELHSFQLKRNVNDPYEVIYNCNVSVCNKRIGSPFLGYDIFHKLHQTNWLLNLPLMREYSKSLMININNKVNISSISLPIFEWFINFDMGILNTVPNTVKELYLDEVDNLKKLLEANTGTTIKSRY